ncbi:ATP-binding protein [Mitsuaria sp. GD03876]|uniref:AAA family ATPase n=1 Tax=Mitsuaria sp. GD03876 TaxID=2975399 RepID=UPI002447F97D|nr:ATP-binding protein [Mitsuaria sp. GD03876]MDH0863141.1 AAA family ATPase [Mitsuaria sp. GD03876]
MQRFNRGDVQPPPALQKGWVSSSRRELVDFMRSKNVVRRQTSAPRLGDIRGLEPGEGMNEALGALFRRRCAFCEAAVPVRAYHFRPVSEALPAQGQPLDHLYYAWLATAWENIYAICESCTPSRPEYFPVQGARSPIPRLTQLRKFAEANSGLWGQSIEEKPLLLDPCSRVNFHLHLLSRWDGHLKGQSRRGEETIEHFNLNAMERVASRAIHYRERVSALISHAARATGEIDHLFDFPSLEYGGTWYFQLRRLALATSRGRVTPSDLTPSQIGSFFKKHVLVRGGAERIQEAWQGLIAIDADTAVRERAAGAEGPRIGPSPSTIKSVRLSNFKAIEDLTLDMPASPSGTTEGTVPSLLILGENAAGKSSILEAIALALVDDAAREGLQAGQRWVLDPGYMGKPSSQKRKAQITIEATRGKRRLTIGSDGSFKATQDKTWQALPVFAYGAFRHYRSAGRARPEDEHDHVRNLFDAGDLANPEQWLLSLAEDRFSMVIRALRGILSIEGKFDVVQRDRKTATCYVVTRVDADGQPMRTPLHAVSSGFRSVLAMACDVMRGLMDARRFPAFESLVTAHGLVLIDEVEAHLHPRWKMRIMDGLREAFPRMTFIATTHDPLCLRGMNDGEVVVLQRIAGEHASSSGLPVFVERVVQLPDVSQLRVDQLLTSDFFQLHSTDSARMEKDMAHMADLLGTPEGTLSDADRATLEAFRRDVAEALPVGSSEVHRVAQEALAEYLQQRRQASAQRMQELKGETRLRIVQALGGQRHAQS